MFGIAKGLRKLSLMVAASNIFSEVVVSGKGKISTGELKNLCEMSSMVAIQLEREIQGRLDQLKVPKG